MADRIKNLLHRNHHFKMIGTISILNMLLAVTAFLKDVVLASYLGTNVEADAFLLAFFIIDTLGNNVIGFSMGICILPVFSSVSTTSKEKTLPSIVIAVNLLMLVLMLFVALVLFANENGLISYFSFGYSIQSSQAFSHVFRILLLTLLIYPLISIANSLLQASDRLVPGVISSLLFNAVYLLAVAMLSILRIPAEQGILCLSGSIVVATLLMLGLLYFYILRQRSLPDFRWNLFEGRRQEIFSSLKLVLKLWLPCLFMIFLSQAMLFMERYFASHYAQGAVAALNYAYRLSQIPVWIFVAAIGMVFFPVMSRLCAEKNKGEAASILVKSLKLTTIITVPMMIGLFALRVPVITLLFKRGAFDDTSVSYTCQMIAGYSLGILGQSIIALCLRFYLALKEIRVPFLLLTASFALNILLDSNLIPIVGLAGIGYGSAISNTLCAGLFAGHILLIKRERINVKEY
jgi:putative peptidoglycan lipid II flippase